MARWRNSERVTVLLGLAGLGIAMLGASRNAEAATPPAGPYTPPGGTPATPGAQPGAPVTYGTFAGPVRGDPTTWRAQRELEALGYDPRGDDGRFGPDTRRALNDFQRDYGLPVTSTLTQAAMDAVEAQYAQIAPPGATAGLGDSGSSVRGSYRSKY